MRIALLVDGLVVGGLESHIHSVANELLKRGHQVLVHSMYTDPIFFQGIVDPKGSFHHVIGTGDPVADLRSFNPDIIHAHPFNAISRGCHIAEALHKPFFITMHGLYNSGLEKTESGFKINEKVVSVIAVDDGVAALLANSIPHPEKIVVIPNGIDLETFYPLALNKNPGLSIGLNPDWLTITFVTRFQDGKENPVFSLLNYAQFISERLRGVNLVLVGFGNAYPRVKELSKIVAQKSKFLNIFLTGRQFEVRPYLAMADLVLGCGRSALEAMACQRPVFAAYQTGFAGLIDQNSFHELLFSLNGYWRPLSERDFIEQIIETALNKHVLHYSARQSCEIVRSQFNIIDVVNHLEAFYRQSL